MERIRRYRIESIIRAVERAAKQEGVESIWKSRTQIMIQWRWQIMRLAFENRYSHCQIGRIIRLDHTTVLHGVVRWSGLMECASARGIYMRKIDAVSREELRAEPLAEPEDRVNREHGFGIRMMRKVETIKAREAVESAKRELVRRKREEEAERAARIQAIDTEMRKLRRQQWSVYGLARRYEMTPQEVAVRIGERIFE